VNARKSIDRAGNYNLAMFSPLITGTILLAGLLSSAMLGSSHRAVLANKVSAKRAEALRRATDAHDAEKRHSKQPYCQDPHYTQSDLNDCAARELGTSLTYYRAYTDAIAQLLEMQVAEDLKIDQAPYRKASLAFRSAETSWQDYSDKACRAVASQNEGGSMQPLTYLSCRVELTNRHMEELATVFSFLWDPER